jgi:hypothetical protein
VPFPEIKKVQNCWNSCKALQTVHGRLESVNGHWVRFGILKTRDIFVRIGKLNFEKSDFQIQDQKY